MISNKINAVTKEFKNELDKEDYDKLVIINPLANMTVQAINSSTTESVVSAYNDPIDEAELLSKLTKMKHLGQRVKLIYFKRPKRGSKALRTLISNVRKDFHNTKVVYIDYERIFPLTYKSKTFTINILDTFGWKQSIKVKDSLNEVIRQEAIVNEVVISKTNLSDCINGIIDNYIKKGYEVQVLNQTSREIRFSNSSIHYIIEGKLGLQTIYPESLKSLVKINDKLSVFLHVVESTDVYLDVKGTAEFIYEVILTI